MSITGKIIGAFLPPEAQAAMPMFTQVKKTMSLPDGVEFGWFGVVLSAAGVTLPTSEDMEGNNAPGERLRPPDYLV